MPRNLFDDGPQLSSGGGQAPVPAGSIDATTPTDANREGSFLDRLGAGFKWTAAGKLNYLKQQHGVDNVGTNQSGDIYLRDGPNGRWYPFDSNSANAKDVLDLGGDIAQGAATLAMPEVAVPTRLGAAVARGVLGGAASSIGRQSVSAVLPGSDEATPAERVEGVALDAGLGAAGDAGATAATGVVDRALRPGNYAARYMQGQFKRPETAPGLQAEKYLGVPLTPGQITQSKGLLTLEGVLRRHPTSADTMDALAQRQVQAASGKLDGLMNRMSQAPSDPAVTGGAVNQAFDGTLNGLVNKRAAQAQADFDAIRTPDGKQPTVGTSNTLKTLDDLIAENDVPGAAADRTKGLVSQLKSLRASLVQRQQTEPGDFMKGQAPQYAETAAPRSVSDFQRLLSSWGRAAEGTSQPFTDLGTAEQRRIARQIKGGLEADLDTAANSPDNPVAAQLQKARNNYKQNSVAISNLRDSTVGRLFNTDRPLDPDRVYQTVRNMKPGELTGTMTLLGKANPDLAGQVKKSLLQDALAKAMPTTDQVAAKLQGGAKVPDTFSPARFLSTLSKSPVYALLDGNEKYEMAMLNNALGRLANRNGTEGSPTAPLQWAMDLIKSAGKAATALHPVGVAQVITSAMAPRYFAKVVSDPAARSALMDITRTSGRARNLVASVNTLAGFLNEHDHAPAADTLPAPGSLRDLLGPQ